ncbi:MAG: hypothetical protein IPK16_06390 [Anaerolineales bacterium]|nr:hypothetical protein [Anaerolineales bacterium]
MSYPAGVFPAEQNTIEAEFASRHPPAAGDIHVNLVAGEMPNLGAWHTLLSSGPAWSIRRRGTARCLCIGAANDSQPPGLIAQWDGDACDARVYCGPAHLKARNDGVVELGNAAGYPVNQLLMVYYLAQRGAFSSTLRGWCAKAAG